MEEFEGEEMEADVQEEEVEGEDVDVEADGEDEIEVGDEMEEDGLEEEDLDDDDLEGIELDDETIEALRVAIAAEEEDEHPVMQSMRDAGCKDEKKLAVAFNVYMGLCEVEKLTDVQWEYNKSHEYFYISGKTTVASGHAEVFIPLSVNCDITPQWLEHIQNDVHRNTGSRSLTLAIKDSDSTAIYYSVSPGLFAPDSPEASRKKKKKQETHNLIESEMQRQRDDVYKSART